MGIDLSGSWSQLWGRISGGAPGFWTAVAMCGVGLLVWSLAVFIWKKRSGGANPQSLIYTTVVGAGMCAPNIIIPILLKFADWIVNLFVALLKF